MHRRALTLSAFAAAILALTACGPMAPIPDSNTGGDGSRDEAVGFGGQRSVTDRIEGEVGDNTDWKYIELEERGALAITVVFDRPQVLTGAYVELIDAFGARVQRLNVTPDEKTYTLQDEVEDVPSRRYIRLATQTGTSIYTIGTALTVRAPPKAPDPAGVLLSFQPTDAKLSIDGAQLANFEQGLLIELAPGAHEIEISKRRYKTFKSTLQIAEETIETLEVSLDKRGSTATYGALVVTVSPADAKLKVGSKTLTSGSKTRIRSGRHRVSASASGYVTKKVTAKVKKDKTTTLDIRLSRKSQPMTGTVYRVTPSESSDSITISIRFKSELGVANGATGVLYKGSQRLGTVRLSNINGKRATGTGRIAAGKATGKLTVKVGK